MSSAEPQSAEAARPKRLHSPTPVTQCKLRFLELRLRFLACLPGQFTEELPPALLECEGKFHSQEALEFTSEIKWSLKFPGEQPVPISISGQHHAKFITTKPISRLDARYYSEINAVILVFPYLRQLIDDLSVKSLGRNILVPPLDVLDWSATHQVFDDEVPENASDGAPANAKGAPEDSK